MNLLGKRILITRPQQQAEALSQKIQQHDGTAILFPTLIIADPPKPQELLKTLQNLDRYDVAIFISPTTVQRVIPLLKQCWPGSLPEKLRIACVGLGTAQALAKAGLRVNFYPNREFGSAALLDLPELQKVAGQTIIVLQGEGGSNRLAPALTQRGAKVDTCIAYRRIAPTANVHTLLQSWQTQGIDVIVSTSNESLKNLWEIMGPANHKRLLATPLLVISQSMVNYAQELGFSKLIVAVNATDQAILASLIAWEGSTP